MFRYNRCNKKMQHFYKKCCIFYTLLFIYYFKAFFNDNASSPLSLFETYSNAVFIPDSNNLC